MIPKERLDEETYVLGRIRAGLSVEHFETQRQTKDGRLVDISLTVSPIRDAAGRVIGASKIARDIREHKRLIDERRVAAENEEAARREVLEAQNHRIRGASSSPTCRTSSGRPSIRSSDSRSSSPTPGSVRCRPSTRSSPGS
jgi:hypothetical protein